MALQSARSKGPRRKLVRRLGWLFVTVIVVLGIDFLAYPYGSVLDGRSTNRGANGLWLRYTWYFGSHSDADISKLAARLDREQIRYAFFHVRSVQPDGTLRFHYAESLRLTSLLHKTTRDTKAIAWIYVDGKTHLSDPVIRSRMVSESSLAGRSLRV